MDIFSTVITGAQIILNFLDACSAYDGEARSLYYRFNWDLRVIKEVAAYLEKRRTTNSSNPQAPGEDDVLLNETAEYLAELMGKVTASFTKVQASKFWWRKLNTAMWILRRAELKELEKELQEWTDRFDVRLLGLPPEVRTIIPDTSSVSDGNWTSNAPAVVVSNSRLQKFAALAAGAKEQKIEELLHQPSEELISAIEENSNFASRPLEIDGGQFIFASRSLPPGTSPETEQFQKLEANVGELAAALHCLDPIIGVSLLKVEYYFYHLSTRQFLFAQVPPYPVSRMQTLENLIKQEPYPHLITTNWIPMNQRLKIAQKLAEAVFFLHTAGFVHKNITSSSIAILEKDGLEDSDCFPSSIGDPFLMGFEMIRGNDATTVWEGIPNLRDPEQLQVEDSRWTFDIFQHPERLQADGAKRYVKNYDVYSLGVVLLEIGFWEPIETLTRELEDESSTWVTDLLRISQRLRPRMGVRYLRVVAWCLGQKGTNLVKDVDFIHEVLDPLENITSSLS